MEADWLKSVKVGDVVAIVSTGYGRYDRLSRVARLTKTQVILEGNSHRYKKDSGRGIGEDLWNHTRLVEATSARVASITEDTYRRKFINMVEAMDWGEVSTESIRRIREILKSDSEEA
jgi:hypothetical protein